MRALLIAFVLLSVEPVLANSDPSTWLSQDVKMVYQKSPNAKQRSFVFHDVSQCRAQIATAVCLVDPPTDPTKDDIDRPCLAGSEAYVPAFEALFDRFPNHLQRVFCSLDKIFVEKEFYATAYARLVQDVNQKIVGSGIGIRKDFLDLAINVKDWASWKEQLNFGASPTSYDVNPMLPVVNTSLDGYADFLYFVVAHEFGHILDFANQLNSMDDCHFANGKITGTCIPTANSWTAMSWANMNAPLPDDDFPLRQQMCFYSCKGAPLRPELAAQLYGSLFKTNFISVYATVNQMEDFADTNAYYTIDRFLNARYSIQLGDGQSYNAIDHLNSSVMAPKVKFLDRFLLGEIKYPGQ